MELKSSSEIIWVNIKQNGKKDLLVCSAYRPDRDFTCIDELDRTISLTDKLNSTTLNGGDFNLGEINWKNKTVDSNASHPEECNKFFNFADTHSLNQIVDEPTRLSDTTKKCLDLFFLSNPSLAETVKVIPF